MLRGGVVAEAVRAQRESYFPRVGYIM